MTAKYRECWRLLIDRNGADDLGNYLEFGVYAGASLACMHQVVRELGLDEVRLFGFDSFEGLPPDDEGMWNPRDFKSAYGTTRRRLDRRGIDCTLVKGWYDETLNLATKEQHGLHKASVVMVDCDLYSSTKQALAFTAPLIVDEAVLLFDDWWPGWLGVQNLGQKRAFEEFLDAHPYFTATELGSYDPKAAKVFLVSRD